MAYVVDICFEKVDIKDKIRKLPLKEKQEQSAAAYQNFYNTILSDPTSDECEELKTFILYYPHKPGDQHAFIDTNVFAHHLLNMGKNVFFLKFVRSKNKNMPDMPEFSIPINCSDVSELTCEGTKGLETKVVDFGDPDVDIHLAQRFPDVIVPPTWFCTEEEHLRIGGGAYNWFKFVKKVEILWLRVLARS